MGTTLKSTDCITRVAAIASAVMVPSIAQAAELKDSFSNMEENVSAAGPLVLAIAFVAGLVFTVMGIIKLINTQKPGGQGGGVGEAIVYILVGVLATGITAFISITSSSIFGGDESGDAMQELEIN